MFITGGGGEVVAGVYNIHLHFWLDKNIGDVSSLLESQQLSDFRRYLDTKRKDINRSYV